MTARIDVIGQNGNTGEHYDREVEHPHHYISHPSGVECIQITEHMNFCLGNAIKYIWRAGLKSLDPLVDLRKAKWYLEREIKRLEELKYVEEIDPNSSTVTCCSKRDDFPNPPF